MKQHRVYSYVGERLMFLGMTLFEWLVGILGFVGVFFCEGALLKLGEMMLTGGLILGSKRMRKQYRGVSIASFMYWHINSGPKRPFLAPSYKRQWWAR